MNNYRKQNFNEDYKHGKQSEELSFPDLKNIFKCEDLQHDPKQFAHFDFFDLNKNIMIELKTRDDIKVIDGIFHYTTRAGKEMILDTLYFDAPKMRFGFQHNKHRRNQNEPIKDYFIVWKCNGDYYHWKINWDKVEYYSEEQNRDWGKGQQTRDVINVRCEYIQACSSLI